MQAKLVKSTPILQVLFGQIDVRLLQWPSLKFYIQKRKDLNINISYNVEELNSLCCL
jgi:hypothetical protein